jgi:hypothetical protein
MEEGGGGRLRGRRERKGERRLMRARSRVEEGSEKSRGGFDVGETPRKRIETLGHHQAGADD